MQNIKTQISNSVQEVIEGNISALEVYGQLNLLSKFIKMSMDEIKDEAFNEAGRYGVKSFEDHGMKFQLSDGKANYSFKHIPEILALETQLKELKEKAKNAAIQKMKFGTTQVDEDGVIIEAANISHSAPSISVKG